MDKTEFTKGMTEFRGILPDLRQRFPMVFPVDSKAVKPLASTVVDEITKAMGWDRRYTSGVLRVWKLGMPYCNAVLRHSERIGLDGNPVPDTEVTDHDRTLARQRIEKLKARKKQVHVDAHARKQAEPASPPPNPVPEPTPEPILAVASVESAPKRRGTLSLKAPPPTLPGVRSNVVVREIQRTEPRRARSR